MNQEFNKISKYWKREYSEKFSEYNSYQASKEFKQIAALFAPGNSYYYILNMHNLELDHVSDSVKLFAGKTASEVTMQDLLKLALPGEIENIQQKENVIKDFYLRFLKPDQILDYKVMYSYQMQNPKGKIITILHQATALTLNKNGFFEHVFSVHSDISHLKVTSSRDISFINMKGGKSYYNINPEHQKFDPSYTDYQEEELSELFSEREVQVINELAGGLNAENIAEKLNLSPHTVKTHRKNILHKSGCSNTAQLIAKCLTGGVISAGLN